MPHTLDYFPQRKQFRIRIFRLLANKDGMIQK